MSVGFQSCIITVMTLCRVLNHYPWLQVFGGSSHPYFSHHSSSCRSLCADWTLLQKRQFNIADQTVPHREWILSKCRERVCAVHVCALQVQVSRSDHALMSELWQGQQVLVYILSYTCTHITHIGLQCTQTCKKQVLKSLGELFLQHFCNNTIYHINAQVALALKEVLYTAL